MMFGNDMVGMVMLGMVVMDFNDIDYDVYFVNDCMFDDFEIVVVEKGGYVCLCIINGVMVIVFIIDMGSFVGELVVVDG